MKEAEEYLKSRNIIKEGFSEFWITFEGGEKIELTEVLQSYADHHLKKRLEEFDDERLEIVIWKYQNMGDSTLDMVIGFTEGAKAILKELKKSCPDYRYL